MTIDFEIGDIVYHLSNNQYDMVVIDTDLEEGHVLCRWVDKYGRVQSLRFLSKELNKRNI